MNNGGFDVIGSGWFEVNRWNHYLSFTKQTTQIKTPVTLLIITTSDFFLGPLNVCESVRKRIPHTVSLKNIFYNNYGNF